ncbi:IclR family transcriptional regulator [Nigerium massiliense]|uniref:IclR family transcriptional regulator n=1 Tax=Nigerium massiliense TaxID=1522317 RepID=UPI000907C952|nr:IclR family transcriptional regulator [Nigerium massiliense]
MSPARGGTDVTPSGAAPAVVRAVGVLDALADAPDGVMTLSDLSRALGVPKSSTSSICSALELGGLIAREGAGYTLGRRLVELGGSYLASVDQVREFYDLCAASEVLKSETVRLSVLAGIDTLVLARYEGRPAIRFTASIGDRLPASTTAQGKVLLSRFEDHEVKRLYHGIGELPQLAKNSLRTVDDLLADLEIIRAQDYGFDNEEISERVCGLAVNVPTRGVRAPHLAVSVTKLRSDLSDDEARVLVAALREVARSLGNPLNLSL